MGVWELPEGWGIARLGDFVEMKTGFACAKKNLVTEGLPHLRPFNVSTEGELNLTEVYNIPEDFKGNADDYTLEPGHILFNNTNSVELVGKTAIVREPLRCAYSNHITRLTVLDKSRLEPNWVALSLKQLWATGFFAANCNKWIGQAGFNTDMLTAVEVPLPYPDDPTRSLAEQHRIVARIKELFARIEEARRLRAAAHHDANRLLDAASADVFNHLEAGGWTYKSFSDVWNEKARYGSFKKPQAEETSYPVIRVGNVVNSSLFLDDLKYLALTEKELERCELTDGDVVVARAIGSRAHLGKCAVFRAGMPGKIFVLDSHLIRVRLKKKQVQPDYVRYYLSSSTGRDEILRNSRQSAIQFNINVRELGSVKFPVPPLSEQRRIIEYLDGVQAQVAELKHFQADSAAELERLEGAILARAFRGEL
jgi:type I restriction enzyme S subunit